MPRKKTTTPPQDEAVPSPAADAESPSTPEPDSDSPPSAGGTGKNYGPPYKAIYTSTEKGFELGENRRFKQRVFTFKDKPGQDVIDRLKEHGFTYRPAEKAWTAPATAESRVLTDRLAREFAGNEQAVGRG